MLQVDDAILHRAVEVLRRGGIVAYPTDTLYGLGADGLDEYAVRKVYAAKGRGQLKALPLLIDSPDALSVVATNIPQIAIDLAARFWPGALTLVLKRSSSVPDAVTGGGDTIALRVPDHPIPRELARRLGAPITGTSANRSGGSDPVSSEVVRDQLADAVDLVIDGGECRGGLASTVVDVSGDKPVLVRQGAIPVDQIEQVAGAIVQPA